MGGNIYLIKTICYNRKQSKNYDPFSVLDDKTTFPFCYYLTKYLSTLVTVNIYCAQEKFQIFIYIVLKYQNGEL